MLEFPCWMNEFLQPFRPLFQHATWSKVQIILMGALLATGKRTMTAVLQVMGLSHESDFAKYHHVLNRAVWSPLCASAVLLRLLLGALAPASGPLLFGIDETLERRRGKKIVAKGIYRDAVRSSQSHFVKASGLRWICLMWLAEIPWAQRCWALPFLSVLAPSERYYLTQGRTPKKLTDWARQMIIQLRRWLPERELVMVGDNSYAALDLLHACQSLAHPVTLITRLRLDAALYEPAPPYSGRGRPRKKGQRLPTLQQVLTAADTLWTTATLPWYGGEERVLELASATALWFHNGKPPVPLRWVLIRDPKGEYQPGALLCTCDAYAPAQIVSWFVRRWCMEVTFEEVRTHLGVETQRQWSDKAIARTTPLLLGLFSWVTLVADARQCTTLVPVRQTAWYVKVRPTFADALSWVRHDLWQTSATFHTSSRTPEVVKIPRAFMDRLLDTVCYAA